MLSGRGNRIYRWRDNTKFKTVPVSRIPSMDIFLILEPKRKRAVTLRNKVPLMDTEGKDCLTGTMKERKW